MKPDELHYAILNELQADARISNAEIGRKIGLTAPAVAERIKRMREEGIIKGFTATIDFLQLDFQQKVLVAVQLPHANINPFLKEAQKMEGIIDIAHVTGEYCFMITILVRSSNDLSEKLSQFARFGKTTTFSILSSMMETKAISLP